MSWGGGVASYPENLGWARVGGVASCPESLGWARVRSALVGMEKTAAFVSRDCCSARYHTSLWLPPLQMRRRWLPWEVSLKTMCSHSSRQVWYIVGGSQACFLHVQLHNVHRFSCGGPNHCPSIAQPSTSHPASRVELA